MTLVNSIQGPTPWRKFRVTVGGSSTVNVDTIPLSTMKSVKYFTDISLISSHLKKHQMYRLSARYLPLYELRKVQKIFLPSWQRLDVASEEIILSGLVPLADS